MKIPDALPAELAWWMARHGAPRHGVFSPDGIAPQHALTWALALTWAVHHAQIGLGDPVAVTAPTPPGLCWALSAQPCVVAWVAAQACPAMEVRSSLTGRAVCWLPQPTASFRRVFRLDPFSEFPADLDLERAALAPGGRLMLVWRGAAPAHLPGLSRIALDPAGDSRQPDAIHLGVWEALA